MNGTVMLGRVTGTYTVPVQESGGIMYTAVALYGEDASVHISTLEPRIIERGRMVVASLTAALDALEDALRRKNAVPVESLAPSEESDIEAATRAQRIPDWVTS